MRPQRREVLVNKSTAAMATTIPMMAVRTPKPTSTVKAPMTPPYSPSNTRSAMTILRSSPSNLFLTTHSMVCMINYWHIRVQINPSGVKWTPSSPDPNADSWTTSSPVQGLQVLNLQNFTHLRCSKTFPEQQRGYICVLDNGISSSVSKTSLDNICTAGGLLQKSYHLPPNLVGLIV